MDESLFQSINQSINQSKEFRCFLQEVSMAIESMMVLYFALVDQKKRSTKCVRHRSTTQQLLVAFRRFGDV
jgi:hypothetical protein